MPRLALALVVAAALALPAAAQNVRVTLRDGRAVEGHLEAFEQGRYRLRLPDGTTREVEERDVRDVVLLQPSADRPADAPPAAQARAAFERGDFDAALRHAAQALHALEAERSAVADLARRAGLALIERSLERRDAAALADLLKRLVPGLPADARQELLARLAGRFGVMQKGAPEDAFTTAFAETLAGLADEGTVAAADRAPLADVFVKLAEASGQRRQWASAVGFYQGAVRVDPSRKDALRDPMRDAQLALAQRRLDTGDAAGALAAAQAVAAADPAHADAKRLIEDAEFARLKQELDVDYGADAPALLRGFLARTARAEHKAWAEQALAKASTGGADLRLPDVAAQMRKYYPVRPGRFVLYRRADGEIQERIRTDAVAREGDVLRVYCTLQEIYRDHATSKVYAVEIERNAIMLPTGSEREPLLRFPARAGDAWTWTSRGREFRRTVRSLGDTVRTGAGLSERVWTDCLVVDFTSMLDRDGTPVAITSRSSYAPGVGLVKLEFLDADFRRFNLDLVEHGQE
jgi:hypothetical protein